MIEHARLLYATSARIGGSGLDAVAHETLRWVAEAGMDWRALAFDLRAGDLDASRVRTLRGHPVRMLSWVVGSEEYYGAKKHVLDGVAARELGRGRVVNGGKAEAYTLVHTWSGEAVRTLRVAKERGIRSLLEIPTWHRHKGKEKPARLTKSERERAALRGWAGMKASMLVSRQQMLEEYELADRILVLSEKAEETFVAAGVPRGKLFRHQRGVDVERFRPAEKGPEIFRCVFVGALIRRKGVHHLLEAWHRLGLKDAELVLVGTVHEEMRPAIEQWAAGMPSVRLAGFVKDVAEVYREASVHVFPSECEGSAKCTYEAAACGLPQIATRESGDVVVDGVNGMVIPPNDVDAIAGAIRRLYEDRALCETMGRAGRERVVGHFTWGHFRKRLMEAYEGVLGA